MIPPLISYVAFNRLGLTVKSLSSLLDTTDDFELHIIDNNSTDGTWDYIQSLDDSRIKGKTHIDINAGQIYSLNINLTKRRPEQYFITLDNDVCIETKDWITKFMNVFNKFPDVGVLGIKKGDTIQQSLISKENNGANYLEIDNSTPDAMHNYVSGCCMFIRPELMNELGYFCEENYFGDMEVCYRVNNFTNFKIGYVTDIEITVPEMIGCSECKYNDLCKKDISKETCFTKYQNLNKNDEFKKIFKWKFDETIVDMHSGARSIYCASVSDGSSTSTKPFNMEWALENVNYYVDNAN